MDTIFAPASARGKAGIAVIRISGTDAWSAVGRLCSSLPAARRAAVRRLTWAGDILDEAVVLCFCKGESFTGEEVAELHLHGATATVDAVLSILAEMPGLRLADPGEFTRRALENGRLDLAQVEGLSDLIEAETEAQRRQAMRVLSGAIGRRAEVWRRDLIRAAALIEATIDFADEDIPVDVGPEVLCLIGSVQATLEGEMAGVGAAERIRSGFEVAIVGRPNAGKSTLLNALAGRDAAITSEIAGTTRDVIEVRMDLGGLPVTILDTAGLRNTEDAVEVLGIERALDRARGADLRIFLLDGAEIPLIAPLQKDIVVQGKSDLRQSLAGMSVSGKTGEGIAALTEAVAANLSPRVRNDGVITRARHRNAVSRALGAMELAGDQIRSNTGRAELAAEELHRAIRALDSLVGRVDVEDLLDDIFSSFCIGK